MPHPSERNRTLELVALLRELGLVRSDSYAFSTTGAFALVEARRGTAPAEVLGAIQGAMPGIAQILIQSIERAMGRDAEGRLVLKFSFEPWARGDASGPDHGEPRNRLRE